MKQLLPILLLSTFSYVVRAQLVSTIHEGNENITDALLVDENGTIYGSDYFGDKVYKLRPNGDLTILIDGLTTPNGLAFDTQKHLFVADHQGNRVIKLDTIGNILDTFPVQSPSGLIQYKNSDTILIAAYFTDALVKLAPDGSTTTWHSGGVLDGPVGLAYDDQGQLYLGNFDGKDIYRVFDDSLEYVAQLPESGGSHFLGFLAYGRGYLWATSLNASKIYRIDPDSADVVTLFGGSLQGHKDGWIDTALFHRPNGIVFDPFDDDLMYVSSVGTGNVRLIQFDVDTTDSNVAVGQLKSTPATRVFPNPCTDHLLIESQGNWNFLELINAQGRTVLNVPFRTRLRLEAIPDGVYTLRLSGALGHSNARIIKTKD